MRVGGGRDDTIGGRGMVFILGHCGALSNDSSETFRITWRKSFRWKPMGNLFWFTASENRCIVVDTMALFLEKLSLHHINISVHCARE